MDLKETSQGGADGNSVPCQSRLSFGGYAYCFLKDISIGTPLKFHQNLQVPILSDSKFSIKK